MLLSAQVLTLSATGMKIWILPLCITIHVKVPGNQIISSCYIVATQLTNGSQLSTIKSQHYKVDPSIPMAATDNHIYILLKKTSTELIHNMLNIIDKLN